MGCTSRNSKTPANTSAIAFHLIEPVFEILYHSRDSIGVESGEVGGLQGVVREIEEQWRIRLNANAGRDSLGLGDAGSVFFGVEVHVMVEGKIAFPSG